MTSHLQLLQHYIGLTISHSIPPKKSCEKRTHSPLMPEFNKVKSQHQQQGFRNKKSQQQQSFEKHFMSLTRCFFSQHTATLAQFNAQRISQTVPPFEILRDITYVMNQNIRKWGRIVKMHLVDLHTIAFLRSTQNPKKVLNFAHSTDCFQ